MLHFEALCYSLVHNPNKIAVPGDDPRWITEVHSKCIENRLFLISPKNKVHLVTQEQKGQRWWIYRQPKSWRHIWAKLCFCNWIQSITQHLFRRSLWKNKECPPGFLSILWDKSPTTAALAIRSWNLCDFNKVDERFIFSLRKTTVPMKSNYKRGSAGTRVVIT